MTDGNFNDMWQGNSHGEAYAMYPHMNAEAAMNSTIKVPPYWHPSLERRGCPFRTWLVDIGIWASGTEVNVNAMASTVAQRLGGVPRNLARQIPPDILRQGQVEVDANGNQVQTTGLE
eukprot:16360339-Heterocapsa_arctica.AAC.1